MMTPPSRPKISRAELAQLVAEYGLKGTDVVLVGHRGYYEDSMGKRDANDRGIYDDAISVYSPTVVANFNANTDPSFWRRGIANLQQNKVWWYKLGKHGIFKPWGYKALVQAAPVMVVRDGTGEDFGYFGINIHRGGYSDTSSLGCQTIHPDQWASFIALTESEMNRYGQKTVPYLLVRRQG
jgi:hypothetical protein